MRLHLVLGMGKRLIHFTVLGVTWKYLDESISTWLDSTFFQRRPEVLNRSESGMVHNGIPRLRRIVFLAYQHIIIIHTYNIISWDPPLMYYQIYVKMQDVSLWMVHIQSSDQFLSAAVIFHVGHIHVNSRR